jgi:isopentenyl-diphosphate delta-isomerase
VQKTVILVDEQGNPIGESPVLDAHMDTGKLHRAFSVFVFRKNRTELLIQKRSNKKMLWPLIWANTCCSHLRPGEDLLDAGKQRLREEMGFECDLQTDASFVYRAEDPGRGSEYEYDTILIGDADPKTVTADPAEVAEWKWISLADLTHDMAGHPRSYAPWFFLALAMILQRP